MESPKSRPVKMDFFGTKPSCPATGLQTFNAPWILHQVQKLQQCQVSTKDLGIVKQGIPDTSDFLASSEDLVLINVSYVWVSTVQSIVNYVNYDITVCKMENTEIQRV